MKKFMLLACIMFLSLPAVGSAAAAVNGVTGMIDTPTADVLPAGHIEAASYSLDKGTASSIMAGAGGGLELGITQRAFDDTYNTVQVKYALRQESILTPGIAVGVIDIGDKENRSAYAIMTKGLPFGIRLNVGLGDGQYEGVFASLEKQIINGRLGRFPTTALIIENNSQHMNYGLRLALSQQIKVLAGYRDTKPYIGVSGSF